MSTVQEIMEAHAHNAGQAVGSQRVFALLDVIVKASERHQDTMPMSVSDAAKMLRHAQSYGYDPEKMVVEVGISPLARTDPTCMSLPDGPSWLCWRSLQDRENAKAMRYIDRMMARPLKVRVLELPLPTLDKPTT